MICKLYKPYIRIIFRGTTLSMMDVHQMELAIIGRPATFSLHVAANHKKTTNVINHSPFSRVSFVCVAGESTSQSHTTDTNRCTFILAENVFALIC